MLMIGIIIYLIGCGLSAILYILMVYSESVVNEEKFILLDKESRDEMPDKDLLLIIVFSSYIGVITVLYFGGKDIYQFLKTKIK